MDKLVINLSDKKLTDDQLSLLSKGLNFCPIPQSSDPGDLRSDLDNLHRRLRLQSHFDDSDEDEPEPLTEGNYFCTSEFIHPKFKPASKFNPPGPPVLESFITLNEHDFNKRPATQESGPYNLTRDEALALKELQKMDDLVIKVADKGKATVLQNREQYLAEGFRQLSDDKFYQKLEVDPTEQHRQEIETFLLSMLTKEEIDVSVYNYLTNKECRTSIFYMLPKIHKGLTPLKGRPIVSAINSPTEKISQFIDHFLNPCAVRKPSYVRDTTHFLTILNNLGTLPENTWLLTLDVTSLYTNIPNKGGIFAAREAFNDFRPNPKVKPSNESLLKLIDFVLTKNNFQFNGEHYLQISGCSMGTKMAPSFANVYMGQFETDFVYTYHHPPLLWKRYIDDVFCLFTGSIDQVNDFVTYLNTCDPSIQFTHEASQESLSFLDTVVHLTNNELHTDLHCKPTDSHNYLLFSSAHPQKCKESIPYSQYLRVRRICSRLCDFDRHMKEMTTHFIRRGYPIDLLEDAALRARRLDRTKLLDSSTKRTKDDQNTILTTTFNPHSDPLREIVSNNWDLLGKSHTTLPLHQKRLLVAYRRPPNLKDKLVRADCRLKKAFKAKPDLDKLDNIPITPAHKQTKISDFFRRPPLATSSSSLTNLPTNPSELPHRSSSSGNLTKRQKKCTNFKCMFCPIINRVDHLTCTQTGETVATKYNISCKSSNLIYCITCKTCNKQYVGQTKNTLAQRFHSHFFNIRHHKKTDAVGLHFSQKDHHGTKDVTINVLEFIRLPPHSLKALELRLKIEKSWIHRLRCPAPRGLNIFD